MLKDGVWTLRDANEEEPVIEGLPSQMLNVQSSTEIKRDRSGGQVEAPEEPISGSQSLAVRLWAETAVIGQEAAPLSCATTSSKLQMEGPKEMTVDEDIPTSSTDLAKKKVKAQMKKKAKRQRKRLIAKYGVVGDGGGCVVVCEQPSGCNPFPSQKQLLNLVNNKSLISCYNIFMFVFL